jgi:hypothetical protein
MAATCRTNQVVKIGPPIETRSANVDCEIAIGNVASGTPPNGRENLKTSAKLCAIGRAIDALPNLFAMTAAMPCKTENKMTANMYPGAVNHHIHIMPRLSQAIENKVPSEKLSRLFCDRLQRAKNIAMPTIDSGHHPHGGKLKPTSRPDTRAAILRAIEEVLNVARVIFI